MNISQFTENAGYISTQVMNRFGPSITNHSNHTNKSIQLPDSQNTNSSNSEQTDEALGILSYIFVGFIGLFLFCLVCCVCFIIFEECCDCNKRVVRRSSYMARYYYSSDSEYGESDREESEHPVFSFETNKAKIQPQSMIIQETPLDEIRLPNQVTEEITCPICLEEIDLSSQSERKVIQLDCQHIYHQDCISSWYFGGVNSVQSCPLCRTKMEHLSIQIDSI